MAELEMEIEEIDLSLLEGFSELSNWIEENPVDNAYWDREDTLIQEMVAEDKVEYKSITMSEEKLHKSFSL